MTTEGLAEGAVVARPWQYSVKVEANAKGWVQPSVHVYSEKAGCYADAVLILEKVVGQLKASGFRVATDMVDHA